MIDLVTQRKPAFLSDPTPQEEAEMDWADKLARQRARALLLRAARERRRLRRVHCHRFRAYPRRLLDSSPRDNRSLPQL